MPHKQLQEALAALHHQLESTEQIEPDDREALVQAMQDIQRALERDRSEDPPEAPQGALSKRIYALIENLENSHPKFAEILHNVSESLANMGI